MKNNVYSVSQVNSYIRNMFTQDFMLRRISVSGEVSNCTYHRSGHIYFTLKDAKSAIGCVMWSGQRSGLSFPMKEGDRVVVSGTVDVYERDGRYQLFARKIELQGAGLLYEQFLKLKKELDEMGMTDPMYKRPIPAYVRTLGIVTAPTGAAVQDIRNVSLRRNPYIQLILYPALVQGEGAAASIVRGIQILDAMNLDCIIVGRGGGSIEDLWAFNEREVAEAIFRCNTPVISAVGHETDTTIADFVADLRAPTPSAAAELAVADVQKTLDRLDASERRLQLGMDGHVRNAENIFRRYAEKWKYLSPEQQIRSRRETLQKTGEKMRRRMAEALRDTKGKRDRLSERVTRGKDQVLTEKRHRLELMIRRYEGLSPLAKLNQGYARAESEGGKVIRSVRDVRAGDRFSLYVRDGRIHASVESSEPLEREPAGD